jgi:Cft2 family RNA processing exonuclease
MADAGRVKHHIKHSIGNPKNTILFVGYCEPNSLGGKLMRNAKQVTIFGEPFEVKAEIQTIKKRMKLYYLERYLIQGVILLLKEDLFWIYTQVQHTAIKYSPLAAVLKGTSPIYLLL